jgi:Flp pilus assembly secretin CpaC
MSGVCVRGSAALRPGVWLAAGLLIAVVAAPAFAGETIPVQVDSARLIQLPQRAATVVIGNPLIADLSIQPNGLAVITGKSYGATNVIVLDKQGAVLNEQTVEVKGPTDPTVVVYRGVERQTYSCTPDCWRRITLGDDSDYFKETLEESTTRNTQAMAAGDKSNPTNVPGGYTPVNAPAAGSNGGGVTITISNGSSVSPANRH